VVLMEHLPILPLPILYFIWLKTLNEMHILHLPYSMFHSITGNDSENIQLHDSILRIVAFSILRKNYPWDVQQLCLRIVE
jgi:hypothetical protein